jgi:hypothetical protein
VVWLTCHYRGGIDYGGFGYIDVYEDVPGSTMFPSKDTSELF